MFELTQIEAKCTSVNVNAEKLGQTDKTRLGMSMYFEFIGANTLLDLFDERLRPSLFERAANDTQEDLTGHLPKAKFTFKKPIAWALECAGYTAVFHPNFEFNKERRVEGCKVEDFTFDIRKDGQVGYKFRIYFNPTKAQVGELGALLQHKMSISLVPPPVSTEAPATPQQTAASDDSQPDLLSESGEAPESDVLYTKAVAEVRTTGNPTASALQVALRIPFTHAATLLARMLDEGVIAKEEGDTEYHVVGFTTSDEPVDEGDYVEEPEYEAEHAVADDEESPEL